MIANSTEPLQLMPVVREFVADTLTPISAYLALATPGRSCLLESVEGTDRIARFSFLGLDYLETVSIQGDPLMLERIRAVIGRYHVERSGLPFPGGVVCAFAYDAARVLERIGPKPPADVAFADALVVVTNDAWYGEGAAAYQHAAHSVLIAVENRRPVLRCGNAGWSGWIDEFGSVRKVLTDDSGSVYFRGASTVDVTRDLRWVGRDSFYVEHGDWFVLVCACVAFLATALLGTLGAPPASTGELKK